MLEAIGSINPKTHEIRDEAGQLLFTVKSDPFFASIPPGVKRKILDGDPPPYYPSQRERCKEYGIDFDYYNAVTMQLSQYVHTLPFSVHQLFGFRAGSAESLSLMSLPLQYVLPFLARVTDEMRALFPGKTPEAPSRTAKAMALWGIIYARGVKSAA